MYGDIKRVKNYTAKSMTSLFRFFADTFFLQRDTDIEQLYLKQLQECGAGMLIHLKSLRTHKRGYGPIIRLLAEAENERMHLMFFIEIAQPNFLPIMVSYSSTI